MNPWESYHLYNRPLFRVGQLPVYVTTLMIAMQVLALILTAILGYGSPAILFFIYSAPSVLEGGMLWTLVTYVFVDYLNFWVALGLVFFYLFGIRVEMRLGTKRYLILLVSLIVTPPVVLTLVYLIFGNVFSDLSVQPIIEKWVIGPSTYWSSMNVHLGILISFIWLHSDTLFWPGVKAKWFGVFFVAVQVLQLLGARMWVMFWMTWLSLLVAYIVLRRMDVIEKKFPAVEDPLMNLLPKRKPKGYRSSKRKLKVLKSPKAKGKRAKYESKLAPKIDVPVSKEPVASVDHLLEKISQSGIASLTDAERKQLESASSELSDQDKPSS